MLRSLQTAAWNGFTRAHTATYRLSRGRIGGALRGAPILLLNHVGRKSGEWRTSPLVYLPDGEDMVVVGSRGGSRNHPAWFLNLRGMEETSVEVDGRTVSVSVHVADPEQRRRLWPRVVEIYSGYADYQRRTDREIPLVILSPID